MSESLHICSTGFNKLPGDDANTRTVEVEIANYDVEPNVRMKAVFKVVLRSHKDEAWLELQNENGESLGFGLSFKPAVKSL